MITEKLTTTDRAANQEPESQFRKARLWSNVQLRKVAHLFEGDVINASAGDDSDKEGAHYVDYFRNCSSYHTSNYAGDDFRGFQGRENEIPLDLTNPLPTDLHHRYDVVFNHTTLEHIYDVQTAFRNLCDMSKDAVILVVPFCQVQHESTGFGDFWRFTPTCMRRMFAAHNFDVIYEAANDDFNVSVYLFLVATKNESRWSGKMPAFEKLAKAGNWVGKPQRLEPDQESSTLARVRSYLHI